MAVPVVHEDGVHPARGRGDPCRVAHDVTRPARAHRLQSAAVENAATSIVRNRRSARAASSSSVPVRIDAIGCSASTASTCARTPLTRVRGSTAVRTSTFIVPHGSWANGTNTSALRVDGKAVVPHVARDADDLAVDRAPEQDVLSDCRFVRPEATRERVVDDGDLGSGTRVGVAEGAAGMERDVQRLEPSAAHHLERDQRSFRQRHRGLSLRRKGRHPLPRQRKRVRDRRRLDAGQRRHAREHAVEESNLLVFGSVARRWQRNARGQHVRGIEAEVDANEVPQAAREQSGRKEQYDRQRNLRQGERDPIHDRQSIRARVSVSKSGVSVVTFFLYCRLCCGTVF